MAKSGTVEYVASLERGLRVLQTFSREHSQLTLSEVASLTGLSPATARRSLHTLELLGYVGRTGRKFLLRPKVLAISAGYLSAINAEVVLQPFLQDMVREVGGSSSVTVLDDLEIVYIAHASANRAIRLTAGAGARYPAYPTSMGRVLLAFEPPEALDSYFQRATFSRLTQFTETNPEELRRILDGIRVNGYATVQDELDYGLVSGRRPHRRSDRPRRRRSQLLGRDQSRGPAGAAREAAAGAAPGRAAHREHAGAPSGAGQFGGIDSRRTDAEARQERRRRSATGWEGRPGLWARGSALEPSDHAPSHFRTFAPSHRSRVPVPIAFYKAPG